jgi:hypothetical protein
MVAYDELPIRSAAGPFGHDPGDGAACIRVLVPGACLEARGLAQYTLEQRQSATSEQACEIGRP